MKQFVITDRPSGALLVQGDPDNPVSTLIQNVDPTNTVYIGDSNNVTPTNPLYNVPLAPGQNAVASGEVDVYGIAASGQTVAVNVMVGFTSFFQPTNLGVLGGASIYVQASAPTQPPPIALNSLWFSPNGAINVWNGTAWVPQTFSGQQIITAHTVFAAQLAAGIIYAGIVDGTVVKAATFVGGVAYYYSSSNPALGTLIGSAGVAVQGTDGVGNLVLPGTCSYLPNAGSGTPAFVTQMYQGQVNVGATSLFTGANNNPGQLASLFPAETNWTSGNIGGSDSPGEITLRSISRGGYGMPYALFPGVAALFTALIGTMGNGAGPAIYADANNGLNLFTAANMSGALPLTRVLRGGNTNNTTSLNAMFTPFPITAGDQAIATSYHIKCGGHGTQAAGTAVSLNFQLFAFGQAWGGSTDNGGVAAGAGFHWDFDGELIVGSDASGSFVGKMTISQAVANATGHTTAMDTQVTAGGVNNGVASNITFQAAWASITGAPTLVCTGASFTRKGN